MRRLYSKMAKLALCLSGQLRTWRKCIDTWHNIYGGYDIDIFCHTWDVNTLPNNVYHKSRENQKLEYIAKEEIEEFKSLVKPKKMVVDPYRVFPKISNDLAISDSNYLSQYYGIMQAAQLKRDYEIENDIVYDLVIRSRYDLFFKNDVSQSFRKLRENTFHGFHFGWGSTHEGRIGDMFWFADSYAYNIIARFYHGLRSIKKSNFVSTTLNPEMVLFYYLKKNNIKLEVENFWDIKIFRGSEKAVSNKEAGSHEIW